MSLYNWIWDLDQESKLLSQEERIEKLENKVEVLYEWIQYLQKNKISAPLIEQEHNNDAG